MHTHGTVLKYIQSKSVVVPVVEKLHNFPSQWAVKYLHLVDLMATTVKTTVYITWNILTLYGIEFVTLFGIKEGAHDNTRYSVFNIITSSTIKQLSTSLLKVLKFFICGFARQVTKK